jgi:hypothetical protein
MVYAGNNEAEWTDRTPMTQVWFVTASDDKFGRVFFGYEDNLPQGGMNEEGLFFDWVNWGEDLEWHEDPQKKQADFLLHQRALETCRSVEDVLALYAAYDEPLFACCRLMVVDKRGASAVLGFVEGSYVVHQSTASFETLGHADAQAYAMLANVPRAEENAVRALGHILGEIRQQEAITTRYTNLHNLTTGDMIIYAPDASHDTQPVTLNLFRELQKGDHYYQIPRLKEQIGKPPQPLSELKKWWEFWKMDPVTN